MADQKLTELTALPDALVSTDTIYVVRGGVDYQANISALGDAALLDVGTTAGTVAAGNHDHSSNKLAQANTHESPDTDVATTSLHHTLGTSANQAAAGNHTHAGVYEPVQTAASQAEMEAGTETAIRSMTPQRVAQAIAKQAAITLAQSTAQTGPVNTTSETAIFSFDLPTNLSAGDTLRLTLAGQVLNNTGSNKTITIRVKLGSTTVISGSVAQPTGTSQRMWMAIVDVYIASTSSQKASMLSRQVNTVAGTLAGYVAGAMEIGGVGVSSEDTTTTKTFQVTAQPDTANSNLLLYAEAATLVKHPAP